MRTALIALSLLLGTATPAIGQIGVTVSVPGVSIGIHLPSYPELVLVPGYPVYYAPQVPANYFFYDGLYWLYQDDNWYSSAWYNGPWELVEPDYVPLFVLRVPVRYYVNPPVFFFGWYVEAAPRWDHHWGHRWTRYHHGWDRWDRRVIYAPAPLPVYQRHYAGDRYPRSEYQHVIRREHYQYQPRDRFVRERDQQRSTPRPQVQAQPGSQGRSDYPHAQQSPRQRDEVRRPGAGQVQSAGPVVREQRQQPRQDIDRGAPEPVQSAPQSGPSAAITAPSPREREDMRRPAPGQVQSAGPVAREQRQQPRQDMDRRAPEPAQSTPQSGPSAAVTVPSPREREDMRRPAPGQVQSAGPVVREQRQQPRQDMDRRVPEPVQPAAHGSPQVQRAEQAPRQREDLRRSAGSEALPQQRGPAMQEQRQPLRQEAGPPVQPAPDRVPRVQQAQRPQQAEERGPQVRSESNQPQTGPERRQGPGQERGQARDGNRGRGPG